MRLLLLIVGLLLALFSLAAEARMHAPYRGHRIVQTSQAPLDNFATPAGAYSMRRLRSAYTGLAVRLRRASDNAEADINFLGYVPGLGAPLDVAAANAHCAATSCTVATWYDQSGSSRNVIQTVPGYQPAFVFNCIGSLPCLRPVSDSNGYLITSGAVAWAAAKTTLSAVGVRSSGAGGCTLSSKHISVLNVNTVANQWQVSDQTTNNFALAAADNAWHAGIGIVDGAGSLGRIDATETAGTNVTGSAAAGNVLLARGSAGTVCSQVEAVVWDNYVLPLSERAALTANQRSFWGF